MSETRYSAGEGHFARIGPEGASGSWMGFQPLFDGNVGGVYVCARMNHFWVATLAAFILVHLSASHALGQNYSWLNATSGNWNDSTRWFPAGVPDVAGETATISAAGVPYTVTLNIYPSIDTF